ncbi:hypothetical protein WUBG_09017 [Wuchereria bancrofti]|uniref:Uncharacterized protein n=1 Tax=Wuchereria bancrofti TaxID=6293 RepID=J9ED37_WUCBA|nr:hypothetical protein WUBG_09017 [Wuchereria bancrofti]
MYISNRYDKCFGIMYHIARDIEKMLTGNKRGNEEVGNEFLLIHTASSHYIRTRIKEAALVDSIDENNMYC